MKHTMTVRVCLRFDDYDNTTPLEVIQRLAEILGQRHGNCLFGVIPFTLDDQTATRVPLRGPHAALLKELVERRLVTPALHGYVHQRGPQGQEEFGYGSLEEQLRKLREGKELLEHVVGREVFGFVPPWNVVTENTHDALVQLGFRYLSTAIELGTTSHWSLLDLPSTGFWQSRTGILKAKQHLRSSPLVVLTGHFYDFHTPDGVPREDVLRKLDDLLTGLEGDPDLQIVDMEEAVEFCSRHPTSWRRVQRSLGAFGMPYRMRMKVRWPGWLPVTGISTGLLRIQALSLLFWLLIPFVSGLAIWLAMTLLTLQFPKWLGLAAGLSAMLLMLASVGLRFRWQGSRILTLATSGALGGIAMSNWLGLGGR